MTAAQFHARYPGLEGRRYTPTDIVHAIRACSQGQLADTEWCEISIALVDREGLRASYAVGCVFEALGTIMARTWLDFHELTLLRELECSQRAGGIHWELVAVGRRQLYWRVVAYSPANVPELEREDGSHELVAAVIGVNR